MSSADRQLLSGDSAIALAALHGGVALGTGYPGTPSTEILEYFSQIGGRGQWAPNEKVALEVGIGVAYGGARALVTMKHVGLNVAADPFFSAAYTGVVGALVVVSADDPGMASSQNEQDNRRYAVAAGVPMLEPADSQEAYDFTLAAIEISERWKIPVLLRVTTRVCHTQAPVRPRGVVKPASAPHFEHDLRGRNLIPPNARPAHRRLRQKLSEIDAWNQTCPLNVTILSSKKLGIITSGVCYMHAREAAPDASFLKLGFTHPLPLSTIAEFIRSVERCVVIEENDPYLADAIRAAGLKVECKPEVFRFGELNVDRVRRILAGDVSPEPVDPPGRPPELCDGCSHRVVFQALHNLDCIVAGDIGCYALGVLPPYSAMDCCVCMGSSIGIGLGLRHVLPRDEAKRVVSVIGDSTFVHSGMTGLAEMIYNPPPTGHVVIILDNGTTAMTGHQEHPGTGRSLKHELTGKVIYEALGKSLGIERVQVIALGKDSSEFEQLVSESLASEKLVLIVARRPCVLAAKHIREYEKALDGAGGFGEMKPTINVVIAGLGGQGVIKASDVLSAAAFQSGYEVKKSELHGMSQRGGSVCSDVRFGPQVLSPMVSPGETDFLLVLAPDQVEVNRGQLRSGGVLIAPGLVDPSRLANRKSLNIALLGTLSIYLKISLEQWLAAIRSCFPEELHAANEQAFAEGRRAAGAPEGVL